MMQNHPVSPRISGASEHIAHGCAGGSGGVPADCALRAVAKLRNTVCAEVMAAGQVADLASGRLLVRPVCARASPALRACWPEPEPEPPRCPAAGGH